MVVERVLRLAALVAMLCLWLHPNAAEARPRVLEGSVTYRERMALPPDALVEVKLLDVSRADAPAVTLGRTTIRPKGQVPVRFRLRYDDSRIKPGRSYALQARITSGGRLMFISTDRHAVFTGGTDSTDILVQRVGGGAQAPATPAGRWLAERIRGRALADRVKSVLELSADGTTSGTGGCNRMVGRATISGASIAFGALASTNMACMPPAMEQERRFFDALGEVRSWQIDPTGRKLALLDGQGQPLVVLGRM